MFTDESSPFKPRSDSDWRVAALVLAIFAGFGVYTYVSHVAAHNEASRALQSPSAAKPKSSNLMAGGRQEVTPRAVVPSPEFISPRAEPSHVNSNARTTIYLCKAYSGGTFWSDTTCGTQRATIDRMTSVPASLPFDQQVAIARGEAQEAARLYESPQPVWAAAMESPAPASARPSICLTYDQQVRDLDAEARRPLPPSRQDQIRLDRMNVMTARARERC